MSLHHHTLPRTEKNLKKTRVRKIPEYYDIMKLDADDDISATKRKLIHWKQMM